MKKKFTERYLFLRKQLDLASSTGVEDARWESFQIDHLCDDSTFRIEAKSRQIAWSWLTGAEAMADAILEGRDSIFVSINKEEAKEKIRYARQVYESIREIRLPKLIKDSAFGLELENGARLTSVPARPPRGRARSNVYLDEFAHVMYDVQIYKAAPPIIAKGGRLRIGSSTFGASGRFWEIFEQKIIPYPDYVRKLTPWWEVFAFCTNVPEARVLAPKMLTGHRVELFGNSRIKMLFANMPLEDFQQEFEALFVDETTAWISWEEIKSAQDVELLCQMISARQTLKPEIEEAIDLLARDRVSGRVEETFAVGVDIGRTRNTTEIYVIGKSTTNTYPLRLAISLDAVEFSDQELVLASVLRKLPITKMYIDRNGIGRNLAENMAKRHGSRVVGVDFTTGTKTLWATDAKTLIQQHRTPLPVDRDLAYQIHSIKKLVTASKNLVFDTDTNEKHHADRFWAWALGLSAAGAGSAGKKTAGALG